MNLKTLITLGFVAMLALLLGLGGYAYYTVHRLDRSSRDVLKENFYSVELGQQILRDSKLNFTIAADMKDGAEKVVALAAGKR